MITRRLALLGLRPRPRSNLPLIVEPEEAIAIVGLFFRSQGLYEPTLSDKFTLTYNRSQFWLEAVNLYVPRSRDLLHLGWQLDETEGVADSNKYARAILRRLGRAFERRDAVWRLLSQKQDIDVSEDIAHAVEGVLTYLVGALDARFANNALHLELGRPDLGWQRQRFRAAIKKSSTALAALQSAESDLTSVIEVINPLRNAIHGVGLDVVTLLNAADRNRTLIRLAPEDERPIVSAMQRLGGIERWEDLRMQRVQPASTLAYSQTLPFSKQRDSSTV